MIVISDSNSNREGVLCKYRNNVSGPSWVAKYNNNDNSNTTSTHNMIGVIAEGLLAGVGVPGQ